MTARCGSGDRRRSSGTAPLGALGCRWPPQTAKTTVRTTTSAMEWFKNNLSKKVSYEKTIVLPSCLNSEVTVLKKVVKSNHTSLTLSPFDNRQEFVRIQPAKNDKFKHTRGRVALGVFCVQVIYGTRYHAHLNLITLDKEFICQVIKKASI